MDTLNTAISQNTGRESASTLTSKTFASSNLLGFSSGVSEYTKSHNLSSNQQVKNIDKSLAYSSQETASEQHKKLKAINQNADTLTREENVRFSTDLNNINLQMQTNGTKLSFTIDENAKQPVVTVTDQQSGNIIRQIPSEEMLAFAERVRELESDSAKPLPGLVIDRQA